MSKFSTINHLRRIAVTLGDINGIGPEISLKAARNNSWDSDTRIVLIGNRKNLEEQCRQLNLELPPKWDPTLAPAPETHLCNWDPNPSRTLPWQPGTVQADAACAAVEWIDAAIQGCMNGTFDAMVTAPICKEGLAAAGLTMPGHTEYLAQQTGAKRFAMMLMGAPLRVVLVTRHLPIRTVANAITEESLKEAFELTSEALPWLGSPKGTIAVCGLNPHAGDGGALGREEKDIIAPAIATAQQKGLPVTGPIPADVVFHQAIKGSYAAVIAMYHDQGLAPLKMHAFESGINITLGLPIVRTSPDHGTAFDLAGKNGAHAGSMIEAIKAAIQLSRQPNPWQ